MKPQYLRQVLIGTVVIIGVASVASALLVWRSQSLRDLPILAAWIMAGAFLAFGRDGARTSRAAAVALVVTGATAVWRLRDFVGPFRFPPGDFELEFESAERWARGQNPYDVPGSGWFPFPAFPLIRLLSISGTLDAAGTSAVFLGLNILALCAPTRIPRFAPRCAALASRFAPAPSQRYGATTTLGRS